MRSREGVDRWVFLTLGVLALLSLALEFGFELDAAHERWLTGLDLGIAAIFGLELLMALVRGRARALRERWYEVLILLLFALALGVLRWIEPSGALGQLLVDLRMPSITKLYLVLVQVFVLIDATIHFLRGHEHLLSVSLRPERLFVAGFGGLILAGTGLLLMPRAGGDPQQPIGVIDAFFTATSAVCVTGLSVRDTGTDFSVVGQTLILFLIQVGGLGIVTFVGLLSMASGKAFSVPQMVALRQLTNADSLADVRRQVRAIVLTALLIECAGTLLLLPAAPGASLALRVHWSVFHAVSAFCNAGFGLAADSLSGWSASLRVNASVMALIVVGGIGAPVIRDLVAVAVARLRPRRRALDGEQARPRPRLSTHTRITLRTTGVLLVVGTAVFFLCELRGVLAGRSLRDSLLASAFQSVSARTAGFNTVPVEALGDAAVVLLIVLMVIGASPVSTGGGIKTTTVGVLFLTLRSMVTGRPVEAFGRSIPAAIVQTAISVVLLYTLVALATVFALSLTDPGRELGDLAFEAVSALSTVGLSRGITASLSEAGQLVLCLAMFAGRVGPLTLAMTVLRSSLSARYRYPDAHMVLG